MSARPEALAVFFEYLDDLRESGATNMFGAAPYLREDFGIDDRGAGIVLVAWMETFSREHSPIARANSDKAATARAALAKADPTEMNDGR